MAEEQSIFPFRNVNVGSHVLQVSVQPCGEDGLGPNPWSSYNHTQEAFVSGAQQVLPGSRNGKNSKLPCVVYDNPVI